MSDLERTINMFRQQQPIVPQVPVPQAPVAGVDFQNILNVMKQFQPAAYTQPQQSQPAMAPNFGAMFGQFNVPNQQSGPPQNMQPAVSYEDPERAKRMREREDVPADGQYDPSWSRQKRTKANEPKPVSSYPNNLLFSHGNLLTFRIVQIWIGCMQVLG